MKTIKRIMLGLLAVVLLTVVGIALLILTLDANLLKPVLHKVAREQGAQLTIAGDIAWQFYPNLGLNLGEVEVSTLEGDTPLASIQSAAVSVKLMPLLRERAILVNGIMLDGLNAQFNVDQNGDTPWSQLGGQATAEQTPTPPAEDQALPQLEIEQLEISNLSLHYSNAQTGDDVRVSDTALRSENFSLNGEPFTVFLSSTINYNQHPTAQVDWQGPVALNVQEQLFSTEQAQINAQLGSAKATIELTNATHFGDDFTSTGTLALQPMALPTLFEAFDIPAPETQNSQALRRFGLQLRYALNQQQAEITEIVVQLDQTRLEGELIVSNFEQPQIRTRWQGDSLNLDDYLPPPTEEEPDTAEQTPPTPLPIEALQALDLEAAVRFEQVIAKGLTIKQPQVQLSAKQGLLRLEKLDMKLADGTVQGTAELDARQPQAKLALDIDSNNVNLGALLQSFADIDNLSGNASASIEATSEGATDQALIDNLQLTASATSQSLSLVPVNIEQQFCKALALVQQETPQNFDWPEMTQLQPVTMQLNLSNQTLQVQQLSAEIANLLGTAQGTFNLASGDFNIPFSLSLADFATSLPGCLPIKEKWRNRALPLRCKGKLDDIGPTTCLPDTKLIGDIIKDRVKAEAKEKLEQERAELKQKVEQKQDKVEQKLEDKTREVITKELGDEQSQELEGKLKGALDRFKKSKEPAAN